MFMKTLKPFVITLLVVLVAILTSCSKSNDDELSETDMMFAKYIGNYSNITCRTCKRPKIEGETSFSSNDVYYSMGSDSIRFSGIKDKHLWFRLCKLSTKEKILEWEDHEETDSVFKVNKGYGEYETCYIYQVGPYYYKKTNGGDIVAFYLSSSGASPQTVAIFTSNNKSKRISSVVYGGIKDWYDKYVFINNCCYSYEGDTIYVAKDWHSGEAVSCEEGIIVVANRIQRNNLKTGDNVWTTECKAPFDIPTDANPKYTSTLLDKSTDVWKYKVNMVYYDGTKKEFTFTININTGEYKASV
jgi:hypothetical protein